MGRFRQIEAETMECLHNQRTFKRMGYYMQQVHQSSVGIKLSRKGRNSYDASGLQKRVLQF